MIIKTWSGQNGMRFKSSPTGRGFRGLLVMRDDS
jgi:hypothetical protein